MLIFVVVVGLIYLHALSAGVVISLVNFRRISRVLGASTGIPLYRLGRFNLIMCQPRLDGMTNNNF
jgi:hypothetical protein